MSIVEKKESNKWYYFDTACDSAFKEYPESDHGKQFVYILSNVFRAA